MWRPMPYLTVSAKSERLQQSQYQRCVKRTLEALGDREADCHNRCSHDEGVIFARTMNDEYSAVQT